MAKEVKQNEGNLRRWLVGGAILVVLIAAGAFWFTQDGTSPEEKAYRELVERTRPKLLKFIKKHPLPKPSSEEEYPMPDDLPDVLATPMRNSLQWFFDNPVPMADGMSSVLELSEEVLLTYQMFRKSSGKAREFMKEYVFATIRILAENFELLGANAQAISDPFTFSSLLTIAHDIGFPADDFDPIFIARKNMLSNRETYEGPMRAALLWALYDLNLVKKSGIRQYWKRSITYYELQEHWLSTQLKADVVDEAAVINAFYSLTHEILPFTGLGKHDIPLVRAGQTEQLQQLMVDSIAYLLTINRKSTDIMCELIVCAHYLHARQNPVHATVLNQAYKYLVDKERDSESVSGKGTFGIDERMEEMGRMTALVRHPVYTGLWAMLSAAADVPGHEAAQDAICSPSDRYNRLC